MPQVNDTMTLMEVTFDSIKKTVLKGTDPMIMSNMTTLMETLRSHCDIPLVQTFAKLTLESAWNLPSSYNASNISHGPSLPFFIIPILTIIFIIVGCVGLVGNLLTVVVICKTASLHSHTNYFLASLAISDLLLIVIGVSFDLINIWRNGNPPPINGYCAFTSTCISLFTFASILTIVSLTAERFQAICYPFNHRALFDGRKVMWLIYLIWIIATIPSVYIGLMFKRVLPDFCGFKHPMEHFGTCDLVTGPDAPLPYSFELTMIITFVLPLIFIIYCYIRILATLNEMSATTTVHTPVGTSNSDSIQFPRLTATSSQNQSFPLTIHTRNFQPPRSQQAHKMVIKMLVTVTSVFFICYLPHHIQRLIVQYNKTVCDSSQFCLFLYPITGLLQYVSAALNPIFYNLMSVRFRTAFNKFIKDVLSKSDKEYSTLARL
ncbi:unnamed protein product [Caenorhabditis bovis]|uniref:G-protein coupled receptors family 1 profile domain-containing protein n=1 Tax=Caenorhabditis bovis TaxID=2654633 RepID=A0A8S1EH78_9PELO|nr:unnamed protein product [Caenorhabditis bovis]